MINSLPSPRAMPPVRAGEEIPAKAVTTPVPGLHIVDFGRNFTGIAETLLFGNVTPIDEEHVEINFSFLQPMIDGEEPHGGVHDAIVADICRHWEGCAPAGRR